MSHAPAQQRRRRRRRRSRCGAATTLLVLLALILTAACSPRTLVAAQDDTMAVTEIETETEGVAVGAAEAEVAAAAVAAAASASGAGDADTLAEDEKRDGDSRAPSESPAPTPSPSYPSDSCQACCPDDGGAGVGEAALSCCLQSQPRNLYGTVHGECSGLPCCSYGGRPAQNRRAWYPCVVFPTCANDDTKHDFCEGDTAWSFTEGPHFACTDACCTGPVLESNVWTGVSHALPGQNDAQFVLTLNPADYMSTFYPPNGDTMFTLQQVVIEAPLDYVFQSHPSCQLVKTTGANADAMATTCAVASFHSTNATHLVVDIPASYQGREAFTITFNRVATPSGVDASSEAAAEAAAAAAASGSSASSFSSSSSSSSAASASAAMALSVEDSEVTSDGKFATPESLSRLYFLFNDDNGNVFGTFFRHEGLVPGTLSSGSFVPDNVYPGNAGNASIAFFTNARIPTKSKIYMTFDSRWNFNSDATWSWELVSASNLAKASIENDQDDEDDVIDSDDGSASRSDEARDSVDVDADDASGSDGNDGSGSGRDERDAVRAGEMSDDQSKSLLWTRNFTTAFFQGSDNMWVLTVEEPIEIGWVTLVVDRVQNPAGSYSGLNLAKLEVRDPKDRLIADGSFSAISLEMITQPVVSPYNYVTMVVLIGTLLFCTIAIRSNGLAFSLGSIWTDLTAVCTVLALVTAIINNLIWALTRSSVYFYISRLFLCFTFTMLMAVCFHWGTVLNLRLRKLPKMKTLLAFVVINLIFYVFQAVFLFYHHDLISRVYESENDSLSYANQQCKSAGSDDLSNTVFSEIQGYLWSCYAQSESKSQFFVVSTTVTSALFLALTVTVMALGFLVMRRGKLLLGNATGPHQVILMKALRLYYTLIGIVTLVYLVSWIVQLASRGSKSISYPWFYIFTVWLPYSIPPCCLIFLQWNSTANSLKDADIDGDSNSPMSEAGYDEVRTPSFAFSNSEWWTEEMLEEDFDEEDGDQYAASMDESPTAGEVPNLAGTTTPADDIIGLSMSFESNEDYPFGCFVAIQRLVMDPLTRAVSWRQISNTDTVDVGKKDTESVANGRHLYSFLSVPRIPASSMDDKIRMVVYAVHAEQVGAHLHDHSEMTAEAVLAALERSSGGMGRTTSQYDEEDETSQFTQGSTCANSVDFQRERAIDALFEQESEPDSADGLMSLPTSFSIVAEFSASTDALVNAGARSEQVALVANEHSYKHLPARTLPPKLFVHTVLPKAARTKYGLTGVASGLSSSHSISSQYHIREQGLLVVEDLTESRFSNVIPRQILEVMIRQRSKQFLMAQGDLARLEAYDQQRQKGTDRGIYENLIQQIQDDGDVSRCREWMVQRCQRKKEYVDLLRRLRRVYVGRDQKKQYFKPSTEKKNATLRFLPINLHLQEMWVGSSSERFNGTEERSAGVYDIVTVGAMAAHVYKFKNGGLLGLQEQRTKAKLRHREPYGSVAARRQSPLWTEDEQKAEDVDVEIQKRMDVCFPQAVAALVTAFTRKIDLALQNPQAEVGQEMLEHVEKLGFLFNVESLVSTHGNEAGMLEDMAGALNALQTVRFVLVDETERLRAKQKAKEREQEIRLSFDVDEEMKRDDLEPDYVAADAAEASSASSSSSSSAENGGAIAGVVDVNVFTTVEDALQEDGMTSDDDNSGAAASPAHSQAPSSSSLNLISSFIRAKSSKLLGGGARRKSLASSFLSTTSSASATTPASGGMGANATPAKLTALDQLFGYTHIVIRIKVRSNKVKLPTGLQRGAAVQVCPVLFTQGINEKQTLANNTGSSVTRLQDGINTNSLRLLRTYCQQYSAYVALRRTRKASALWGPSDVSKEDVNRVLTALDKLISAPRQIRKKRPEILQLSSDLCRRVGGGRVTVCKSAKDRTGMSVTLEQGRILVQNHHLPANKRAGIVSVMRTEGVRIENALKNTGRRVFAFNALQRSLLPEEYRCPPQTAGKNVS